MQKIYTFQRFENVFDDPLNSSGEWNDERAFRRSYWTPTLKRLGIRYRQPYQCRHTNATMRLMAGQRLAYAAQQMGHSVDMFVKKYARWLNDGHSALEDAKLEEFLALEVTSTEPTKTLEEASAFTRP
jgi:integrase